MCPGFLSQPGGTLTCVWTTESSTQTTSPPSSPGLLDGAGRHPSSHTSSPQSALLVLQSLSVPKALRTFSG